MKAWLPIVLMPVMNLAACSSPANWLVSKYGASNNISAFEVCKNYGCAKQVMVSLSGTEWAQIRALFAAPAANPAAEREQVRQAVALLERLVGPKAGTDHDKAGADIINFDREGQLDCIDETYNTTTYLKFLAADGLLKWHDVGPPALRGYFFDRWPHNTATLIEHGSNTAYTVDSWFHANGELPETVLLSAWLKGWSPPKT